MEKINFENLPSKKTPLTAENLKLLQDNIEKAIDELDPSKLTNEATEVNNEDLLLVVQNGVKKKVPASKVGTGQGGVTGDTLPIRFDSRIWKR